MLQLTSTRYPLPRLLVLVCRFPHHFVRHDDALLPLESLPRQPIAEILLIEALLALAHGVRIPRPESRRVRREHFVDQHDFVGLRVESELELRVRDDQPALVGVIMCGFVEGEGEGGNFAGIGFADDGGGCSLFFSSPVRWEAMGLRTLVRMDVLIMLPLLGLGARRVDRPVGERLALFQPRPDGDPMHRTGFLVLLPRRARDVSAYNGFDWKDLVFSNLHAPILQRWAQCLRNLRREVKRDEMRAEIRDGALQDLEPGFGAEGEEFAFVWDALDSLHLAPIFSRRNLWWSRYVFHDHIVCGDAVRRDEEERLVVNLVEIAHFASRDQRQSAVEIGFCQCLCHCFV